MKVKIKKLNKEVKTPQYKTANAACADLAAYFKLTPKEEFRYIPNREYVFQRISDHPDVPPTRHGTHTSTYLPLIWHYRLK